MSNLVLELFKKVPKNSLSHLVGEMVHWRLPEPLSSLSVKAFAKKYNINLSEAEFSLEKYPSIGELFTRKLKEGVRPIQKGVVHPVDGVITAHGPILNDTLLQAKGKTYSLTSFLESESMAATFHGGYFITYYLCPTDYHRIHSPISGQVVRCDVIPGELWPVNQWSVSNIENLFAINERVITYLQDEKSKKKVAVVKVGATNVGKISVSYDEQMVSNVLKQRKIISKNYDPPISVIKGQELGVFHMGSTVILLFPKELLTDLSSSISGAVKMGETLFE